METPEECVNSIQASSYSSNTLFWCLFWKLSTDFTYYPAISIVHFKQVNSGWKVPFFHLTKHSQVIKQFDFEYH